MESLLFTAGVATLALGGAMVVLASNVVRHNRRREAARVQLLSALAFPDGAPIDTSAPDASFAFDTFQTGEVPDNHSVATGSLFVEPAKSGASSRRAIVLAALGVVLTVLVGAYKWSAGTKTIASEPAASTTTSVVQTLPTTPPDLRVELLALDHRMTPGALLVTGRVRNPMQASALRDLVAVVHFVDGTGRVLMTVRAPVKGQMLNGGESADFSAAATNATNADRYRVEFYTGASDPIPLIDRRQTESAARSQ